MHVPARMTRGEHGHILASAVSLVVVGVILLTLGLGMAVGIIGLFVPILVISASVLLILLLLRQDEWIAVALLMLSLYVDWYQGHLLLTPVLTGALLLIFFLARSPQYNWSKPCALWLWMLYLVLALFPALEGSLTRYDAAFYYPNIVCGAFLMFWLGTVLARDVRRLRRFFKILAALATCLAIITIIQDRTGILLLGTTRFDISLASVSNYNIFQGSNVYRLGSFFVNPDWNGAFFATLLCIPLGLCLDCLRLSGKIFYLTQALIILPALLFTYSIGSWASTGVGILAFVLLSRRMHYRIGIALFIIMGALILLILFPEQIALLLRHGSDPTTLMLRNGAWHTAMRVIQAHPFTGIGLGLQAYMRRAEPYRVPEQYRLLAHPHNSYLELGAMAGLPVLACFVGLILYALGRALCNWRRIDSKQSALLGGGIAAIIALSTNSLSVNAWTLPPLAACGWLILGLISSPLLSAEKNKDNEKGITHELTHAT
ncbi:O-antigen ligase family protein [Dictyobacter arantiisoli]|uniref:O-antigen ligase-related domain-containing protein n=1 Tax=Dictyobacter arantiisoli TaxID=2014874 RepID=A0A5A5TFZ2_9CHLR|nr:O-antigen ligase family protein [Dictyobacter arantiisoli]GCF10076.1 hypothetical protein KDI_36400 [Dictyobacter arantiisoli]